MTSNKVTEDAAKEKRDTHVMIDVITRDEREKRVHRVLCREFTYSEHLVASDRTDKLVAYLML